MGVSDRSPIELSAKKRARETTVAADATTAWRLEPHVCRVCFGRIASQPGTNGRHYVCTNCGAEKDGHSAAVLCACGTKIRKHRADGRSSDVLVDAGIRCHENKQKSPEFPSLYVASYAGAQPEP